MAHHLQQGRGDGAPSSVNKASGLTAALDALALSPLNAVGVGDAENDQAFLRLCACSVAVANALPAVKEAADFVTAADHGAGVVELVERLLERDLQGIERCTIDPRTSRGSGRGSKSCAWRRVVHTRSWPTRRII